MRFISLQAISSPLFSEPYRIFYYDCSGQNLFIALFAPVNESIWGAYETSFSRCFYMRFFCLISDSRKKNFIRSVTPCCLKFRSERSAFPYFYTYSGILGRHLPADIAVFLLGFLCFPICMERKGYGPDRQPAKMDLSIDCAWLFIFHLYLFILPDRIVSGFKLNNVHFF